MNDQAATEMDVQDIPPEREEASFGTLLKHAREQRGWSMREVASRLRIPERTVEALEEAREDALPEPTFVRGYLRLYARLLDLNEEDLIRRYNGIGGSGAEPERTVPEVASAAPRARREGRGDRWLWGVTGAIALTAGLALFAQWQEETAIQFWRAEAETGAAEQVVDEPTPSIADAGSGAAPPTVPTSAAPADDSQPASGAEPAATAIESTESAMQAEPAETTGLAMAPTAEADTLTEPEVADAPATSGSEVEVEAAAPEPVAVDRLALRLSGDSWVEVHDSTGQRLVYALLEEGTRRQVTGVAPFRVVLGDPTVVALQLNGAAYDTSRYEQGRVARMSVAADGVRE